MPLRQRNGRKHFVFVSGNRSWGGSEELWSAAAAVLAEAGERVTVYKSAVDPAEPRLRRLAALACPVRDLSRFPLLPPRIFSVLERVVSPLAYVHARARLRAGLTAAERPDLVVVSQGGNHDGCFLAETCRRLGIPYVLIAQKASEMYWPPDASLPAIRTVYEEARACFFVSAHNLALTEEMIGCTLPNARLVRNPFAVPYEAREDWPDDREMLRLACIGRLYPKEKGQDLLLRVLARPRWRGRPVAVTFYGSGTQAGSLEAMARYHGLANVRFAGFVRDVGAIWDDHHALVLPSRCEGLPLVVVEAMLSGRVPIVTNVGGTAEVIDDDVTGFVATAAAEDALDAAMERAWNQRERWREIGAAAAARIRTLVPADPAAAFAGLLRDAAGAQ